MAGVNSLESVLDYILNQAGRDELEVIGKALGRRSERLDHLGTGQIDPSALARQMSGQIQQQMGISRDAVRGMARNYVRDMIHQKAPELSESQIEELMGAWVPDPDTEKKTPDIPRDALLKMVKQFVAYSTHTMSRTDYTALCQEMPDWVNYYWSCFPERVCKLIVVYLDEKIDGAVFWQEVKASLVS